MFIFLTKFFKLRKTKMPKIISKSSFKGLNSLMEDNYKYLELKFPEECLFNINDAFENFKNDMDQTLEGVQKLIFDLAKRFVIFFISLGKF